MKENMLFLMVFLMVYGAFAAPQREETIFIRNYSSQNIIITREYQDEPSKIFSASEARNWIQIVHGINLTITDIHINRSEIVVRPNQMITILSYVPFGSIDIFERLAQIPFLNIMRGIYKSFKIITDDGRTIIDLENIEEQNIRKNVPHDGIGIEYIIEIFDYDIEGRPASEW